MLQKLFTSNKTPSEYLANLKANTVALEQHKADCAVLKEKLQQLSFMHDIGLCSIAAESYLPENIRTALVQTLLQGVATFSEHEGLGLESYADASVATEGLAELIGKVKSILTGKGKTKPVDFTSFSKDLKESLLNPNWVAKQTFKEGEVSLKGYTEAISDRNGKIDPNVVAGVAVIAEKGGKVVEEIHGLVGTFVNDVNALYKKADAEPTDEAKIAYLAKHGGEIKNPWSRAFDLVKQFERELKIGDLSVIGRKPTDDEGLGLIYDNFNPSKKPAGGDTTAAVSQSNFNTFLTAIKALFDVLEKIQKLPSPNLSAFLFYAPLSNDDEIDPSEGPVGYQYSVEEFWYHDGPLEWHYPVEGFLDELLESLLVWVYQSLEGTK